jgi:broad specificity phosphatase PhoE
MEEGSATSELLSKSLPATAFASRNHRWQASDRSMTTPAAKGFDTHALPQLARGFAGADPVLRLILIRHGQSANRGRAKDENGLSLVPASKDPGLTELGHRQAMAVKEKLSQMNLGQREPDGAALIVSSPMQRCLLTVHPAIQELEWTCSHCLCHGGAYERGCAGLDHVGSSFTTISRLFPEFSKVGFNAQDHWDYRGGSSKETDEEFVERGIRLLEWLLSDALDCLRAQNKASAGLPTLIFCMHQTLCDLLSHLLLEGSAEKWAYAQVKYKMDNAAMSEFFLYPDGRATCTMANATSHLWSIY